MQGDLVPTALGNPSANAGMIPRVLFRLFHHLETKVPDFTVKVSYVELYNEELRDLLTPVPASAPELKIFDDASKKGVFIQGLEEVGVRSAAGALAILTRGSERRQIAATRFNDHSSRSHAVFSLTVHTKETSTAGEELLRVGKMNLVDLAGSENVGRSGAVERRAKEAGMINQSLLTLGRVINALADRGGGHVPYRESKLTRLLQDSLGGRTKTCIVATVSPAACNAEETLSTLDYALRAKSIRNKPELNQRLTRNALLREYVAEIERLKADVRAARDKTGVFVSDESFEAMEAEQARARADVLDARKHSDVLEGQMRNVREEFEQSMALLVRSKSELAEAQEKLDGTERALGETRGALVRTESALAEEVVVRAAHAETEEVIDQVAGGLRQVASEGLQDLEGVFSKLGSHSYFLNRRPADLPPQTARPRPSPRTPPQCTRTDARSQTRCTRSTRSCARSATRAPRTPRAQGRMPTHSRRPSARR
jgi:kinesin family protein 11